MGGLWEVSGKHLPSHIPFIHRPFTFFTGGGEVFYILSFSRHRHLIFAPCLGKICSLVR